MERLDLDFIPRNMIVTRLACPKGEPEMKESESAFLCGLINKFKTNSVSAYNN